MEVFQFYSFDEIGIPSQADQECESLGEQIPIWMRHLIGFLIPT